jgi:4-carboxymuconolactone decarboxylase
MAPEDRSPPGEMRYAVLPDRMPPIPDEQMTDAQRKVAADIAAGPRGRVEGPYWPILRSPGLTAPLQKVGEYYRYHCPLDRKLNEMAALITARWWSQQFVWDVHILQALEAGLTPAVAEAIAEGRRPTGMTADEEILWDFLAEVLATQGAADPTYERARAQFGEAGIVDILGIVGYYTTLALIMNVARTPLLESRRLPINPLPLRIRSLESNPLRG